MFRAIDREPTWAPELGFLPKPNDLKTTYSGWVALIGNENFLEEDKVKVDDCLCQSGVSKTARKSKDGLVSNEEVPIGEQIVTAAQQDFDFDG